MHVSGLFVYPVKGCRGFAVDRWPLERCGPRHDRRWMIVDADGMFLTQRELPALARVDVAVDEDAALTFSTEGRTPLRVPLPSPAGPRRAVRVWKSDLVALDCGADASAWLTAHIGTACTLVRLPDDVERAVDPDYGRPDDVVGFADGFPLLLTTTASLVDLNARLETPVGMDRFRPSVVVEGASAWEEDHWTDVRIGDVPLRSVKPCGRCVVVTTDQKSGARGVEPLRTLASFRTIDGRVVFGQNCIPDAPGTLSIGDPVHAIARA